MIKKVKEYYDEKSKEVIDWWEKSGLLEGLNREDRISLALIYESIKRALLTKNTSSRTDTVIFPIARYCFSIGHRIRNVEVFIDYVDSRLSQDDSIKRREAIDFCEEHYGEKVTKEIDYEAYFTMKVAREVVALKL